LGSRRGGWRNWQGWRKGRPTNEIAAGVSRRPEFTSENRTGTNCTSFPACQPGVPSGSPDPKSASRSRPRSQTMGFAGPLPGNRAQEQETNTVGVSVHGPRVTIVWRDRSCGRASRQHKCRRIPRSIRPTRQTLRHELTSVCPTGSCNEYRLVRGCLCDRSRLGELRRARMSIIPECAARAFPTPAPI